jgi:hypothetical protein
MTQVKSALALGLRPSAHILSLKKPMSNWSEGDHKIAVAYSRLEAEICQHCQNPIWICRTTDERVLFKVEKYRCFGDAKLEDARKKRQEKKKELRPGEHEYVRAYTYDGSPLPTRIEWLESLQKGEA